MFPLNTEKIRGVSDLTGASLSCCPQTGVLREAKKSPFSCSRGTSNRNSPVRHDSIYRSTKRRNRPAASSHRVLYTILRSELLHRASTERSDQLPPFKDRISYFEFDALISEAHRVPDPVPIVSLRPVTVRELSTFRDDQKTSSS